MTTLDKMLQGLANALGASLSTLTTTAKTVVGAINELASAVSSHTSTIGSGTLDTTSQTLIGAVNELNSNLGAVSDNAYTSDFTATLPSAGGTSTYYGKLLDIVTITKPCIFFFRPYKGPNVYNFYFGISKSSGGIIHQIQWASPETGINFEQDGYRYVKVEASSTLNYYTHIAILYPGTYTFGAESALGGTVSVNYMRLYFN